MFDSLMSRQQNNVDVLINAIFDEIKCSTLKNYPVRIPVINRV